MFVFLFILMSVAGVQSELIEIQNQTHIHCVTENDPSATFISPPLPPIDTKYDSSVNSEFGDEWIIKNSSNFLMGPITDKRWEDFTLEETWIRNFTLSKSLSFSVYGAKTLAFIFYGEKYADAYTVKQIETDTWTHFTVALRNNNTYLLKNAEILYTVYNLHPQTLTIDARLKVFWKIHDHTFKWTQTPLEKPTILKIPPANNSHLIIYTISCPTCLFTINKDKSIKPLLKNVSEEDFVMASWSQHVIQLDSHQETTVTITTQYDGGGSDNLFWGIDARTFNNLDTNTFEHGVDKTKKLLNYNCQKLLNVANPAATISKPKEASRQYCGVPGWLGSNCDIACESLLGRTHKFCEKHKICMNKNICICAWGYKGEYCDERCDEGMWGLSCLHRCPINCPASCDHLNGQCGHEHVTTSPSTWFIILVDVVVYLVLICISRLLYKFCLKKESFSADPESGLKPLILIPSTCNLASRS